MDWLQDGITVDTELSFVAPTTEFGLQVICNEILINPFTKLPLFKALLQMPAPVQGIIPGIVFEWTNDQEKFFQYYKSAFAKYDTLHS